MSKVPVIEIFGPTIQGEGMVIGQKTMFVRTAGCDYSCSWCDSAFTWDGSGKDTIKLMDAEEIWQELKLLGGDGFTFVTISGGNPALLKNLSYFINLLKKNNVQIGLETQGSKWQDWFLEIDELTISPKPPSSGMVTNFSALDMIFDKLKKAGPTHSSSLKVVVFDDRDFDYAKQVHYRYPEIPFYLQVGNADHQTRDNQQLVERLLQKYEWLVHKVVADNEWRNVKVLPQLHTLIWGNRRGV
ncbi:7-carboxy-7-deazaguanine synthase QueE [Siminovitchia sp. FSL H7-0308]|uniref:7-carboxy-7-deazaguanine synthase n=1 Tax=Siminovitchia thermophila TaxID=1245522 RepID=A0ABS2R2L5_9BACI|nr:7-carboxy-7-deazaguanine synthase QueE [Siminovitchia thermophila]MBM7713886.1 7-carboxy-7-deazaguanine synthase [Siminovitchia thermophila]ONK22483.1 7-carboxy-7-deazaguanine synthase QueE [Bacillus sp. VT-16-64]